MIWGRNAEGFGAGCGAPFNLEKKYGNSEVNDTLATDEYLKWGLSPRSS